MTENLKQVLAGAGSYIALIIMVWFAMKGAPVWMTFVVAISNGFLFTYLVGKLIPIVTDMVNFIWSIYSVWLDDDPTKREELFSIYAAHIQQEIRMSYLREGIDSRSYD